MAKRAGARSVVLDLFADSDTAEVCDVARRVSLDHALGFHGRRLLRAASEVAPPAACAGLVAGSGFEGRPKLLARLAAGRRLYGNSAQTITELKQPATLFPLLDSLGISYPATTCRKPRERQGWLVKHAGGAGGAHVQPASRGPKPAKGCYFQRFVAGRSLSVLFLADGRAARVIGFNEQWPAGSACSPFPFSYGGATSDAQLAPTARARVEVWATQLTERVGLVGLNGIDFILDDEGTPYFLEINPRPTATGELYDERAAGGLFRWHVEACEGNMPADALAVREVRGHAIVYAASTLTVPAWVRWPYWVTDRPEPGASFRAGAPVCTVHAVGKDVVRVERLLFERSRTIMLSVVPLAA